MKEDEIGSASSMCDRQIDTYRLLVGNPEGKTASERPCRILEDNEGRILNKYNVRA
jgi:hypothetical protein